MRPQLLMLEETTEWDDLDVRVVVESNGEAFEGRAKGSIDTAGRLRTIGEAALAAADAAMGGGTGFRLDAIAQQETGGHEYVLAIVIDPETSDALVGAAALRSFEEVGQVATRAVLDAVNRHLSGHR